MGCCGKTWKLNRTASLASAQSLRKFPRCQPLTTWIKWRQSRLILGMRGRRESLICDLHISSLMEKKKSECVGVSTCKWSGEGQTGRWTDRLNWNVKHFWRQQSKDVVRNEDHCNLMLSNFRKPCIQSVLCSSIHIHTKHTHIWLNGCHLKGYSVKKTLFPPLSELNTL